MSHDVGILRELYSIWCLVTVTLYTSNCKEWMIIPFNMARRACWACPLLESGNSTVLLHSYLSVGLAHVWVKWLGAWQKVHLFFQDHKSGSNPTAAPLQAAIGDLIFADFKQNHLSAPVSWCRIQVASLTPSPPKNSAHPQNPFLN